MYIKQLLIFLFKTFKGLIWFFLVGLDNKLRFPFGFSPLLRTKAAPEQKDDSLINENIKIRITASSLSPIMNGKMTHRLKNVVYHPFDHHYNIAICLRELVRIRRWLKKASLMPADCHLIRKPSAKNPLNPAILSLFNCFAKSGTLAETEGDHLIHRLIRMKAAGNFWQLWDDKENIRDFRQELLQANSIQPAPPVRSVHKIVFIRRRNYEGEEMSGKKKVILRKISNEEDIISRLSSFFPNIKVQAVRLEEMSLAQQLNCINSADILIGMHGAGLGQALLMKPNSGLLEIFPLNFSFPHTFYTFYAPAAVRSLHYARFLQILPWKEYASEDFRQVKKGNPAFIHSSEPFYYTGMLGDSSVISPAAIIRKTSSLIKRIHQTAKTTICY